MISGGVFFRYNLKNNSRLGGNEEKGFICLFVFFRQQSNRKEQTAEEK